MIDEMRKFLLFISILAVFSACSPSSKWGDKIIVCGDCELYIVDAVKSSEDSLAVCWHWSIYDEEVNLPEEYESRMWSIDDCKSVCGGKKLLVTSGGGSTLLVDIDSKRIEFFAHTPMVHSAAMLPGNRIAVVNSTHPEGNSLELYEVGRNEEVIWRDSLYSGHGVVWSEKYKSLFALGYDELRRYRPVDWESDKPSLELVQSYKLSFPNGHELSPAGKDLLVVSTYEHVELFNIAEGCFEPFGPLYDCKDVKSANYDPALDKLVFTKAEDSWWTNHVYLENPDKTLTFNKTFHLYKCRVLE